MGFSITESWFLVKWKDLQTCASSTIVRSNNFGTHSRLCESVFLKRISSLMKNPGNSPCCAFWYNGFNWRSFSWSDLMPFWDGAKFVFKRLFSKFVTWRMLSKFWKSRSKMSCFSFLFSSVDVFFFFWFCPWREKLGGLGSDFLCLLLLWLLQFLSGTRN